MIELLIWIAVFVVALAFLIKASDAFTDSAEKIGLRLGLPAFIVGVTIVSIGTSLPELVSSIIAVLAGSSEIVVANVVGSNIANVFLVLGFCALISKKLKIAYNLAHVDVPMLVGSALLLWLMVQDGSFVVSEAIIVFIGLVIYLAYTMNQDRKANSAKDIPADKKMTKWTVPLLFLSIVFIYLGAKYTIEAVIKLSTLLNVGAEVISVSAIALGTSLPELAVSWSAAKKGKAEIAVGNVLGSNIFNTFAVMSIPTFVGVLTVPSNIITFAMPVMMAATFMFFFITRDQEITKWEGLLLLLFYFFFIGRLFGWI